MTTVLPAVRPRPLPDQRKPWRKAGIHLLCIYAVFGLWFVRLATHMYSGLDEGRETMEQVGMAPYLEGAEHNEAVDPVTSEVAEIGALNYDLHLALIDDWLYSGYSHEDKLAICGVFQVDPAQVWQQIAASQGYVDTPENRATSDAFYAEWCAKLSA